MLGFASRLTAAKLMSAAANVPLTAHLDEATRRRYQPPAMGQRRQPAGAAIAVFCCREPAFPFRFHPHLFSRMHKSFTSGLFSPILCVKQLKMLQFVHRPPLPRCGPIGRSPGLYGSGDGWNGGGRAGASGIGWRPVGRFHQIQSGIKLGVTVP
jgi:hypothetical protein